MTGEDCEDGRVLSVNVKGKERRMEGETLGTNEIGVNNIILNQNFMLRTEEVSKDSDKGNAGLVDVNRPVVPQPRGDLVGEVDLGGVENILDGPNVNIQEDNDREELGGVKTCTSGEYINMQLEDDRLEISAGVSDASIEANEHMSDFLNSTLISKGFENDVRQAISEVDAEQRRGNDRLEKVLESLENRMRKEKEETTQMLQSVSEMYEDTPRRSQRIAKKNLLKEQGN